MDKRGDSLVFEIDRRNFQQMHDLNFDLLADYNGSIAKSFGVPLRDGGQIKREFQGKTIELERGGESVFNERHGLETEGEGAGAARRAPHAAALWCS